MGDGWHPVGPDVEDYRRGAQEIRRSGREVALSARMTPDVRKKREPFVGANKERRVAVSGTGTEIRKATDAYAEAGLEYYCASINHPEAAEIVSDLRKFSAEVIRSFA